MADKVIIWHGVPLRLTDNGDETWSLSTGAGGGSAGDASAAKQDAQTALLTSMDTDTGGIAVSTASLAKARGSVPAAGEVGVLPLAIRDDALSALTGDDDGELTPHRIDGFGRLWTVNGGAQDAIVDSIQTMPVPGIAGYVHKSADYTTTQTGAALWDPDSSHRFVVTNVFIEIYGSDDGNVFVWSSTSAAADTSYTPGTDRLIAQLHRVPSTAGAGGVSRVGFWPGAALDYPVRVTTTNNVDCTVSVDGYESTI